MDIKLKKFNDKLSVRAAAFVLCIALLMVSVTTVFIGAKKVSDLHNNSSFNISLNDLTQHDSYFDTESFSYWTEVTFDSMTTLGKYVSRDEIKSGKYISDSELSEYLEDNYMNDILSSEYTEEKSAYYTPYGDDPNNDDFYYEAKSFSEMKEQYMKDYPNRVKQAKDSIIYYQLGEFDSAKKHLDGINGLTYNITVGETSITNQEAATATEYGYTLNIQNGKITTNPESKSYINSDAYLMIQDQSSLEKYANNSYVLSLNKDVVNELNNQFADTREVFSQYSIIAVATFIGFLLLLIYQVVITGRRDEEGNVILYRSDRLFTEFQFLLLGGLCGLAVLPFLMLASFVGDLSVVSWMQDNYNIALLILGVALETIIASGILWVFLSIIRMLKAHIFISRSLLVIAVKTIYKWITATFSNANPMGKFVIIIVGACLASMTVFLGPIAIALLLGFGYKWIRKYTEVKKGVEEVNSGNLEYKIPVDDKANTEFDQLARQINSISMASNVAIQNELKNQRLKTDLISNVSHDLKTPLTSIITYTDLLKKEGLSSPNAENYLSVIDDKGQRLKALTEDLFEAAKASSGSIPVRLEKVDVLSLINQGLVELGEGLKEKGLDIIINAPNEKYYVNADSQLLWRVVENLLNNLEKYALENSRVYIDLSEKALGNGKPPMIMFEMKNMSKAPLNIAEEELMERFKRGDESRTTEGSGLGLAIAKDLVKLQSGVFELKIDGDLFKSTVMLESYDEDTIKAAQRYAEEKEAAEEKINNINEDDGRPRIR